MEGYPNSPKQKANRWDVIIVAMNHATIHAEVIVVTNATIHALVHAIQRVLAVVKKGVAELQREITPLPHIVNLHIMEEETLSVVPTVRGDARTVAVLDAERPAQITVLLIAKVRVVAIVRGHALQNVKKRAALRVKAAAKQIVSMAARNHAHRVVRDDVHRAVARAVIQHAEIRAIGRVQAPVRGRYTLHPL